MVKILQSKYVQDVYQILKEMKIGLYKKLALKSEPLCAVHGGTIIRVKKGEAFYSLRQLDKR